MKTMREDLLGLRRIDSRENSAKLVQESLASPLPEYERVRIIAKGVRESGIQAETHERLRILRWAFTISRAGYMERKGPIARSISRFVDARFIDKPCLPSLGLETAL
jgi:hypothetical protein